MIYRIHMIWSGILLIVQILSTSEPTTEIRVGYLNLLTASCKRGDFDRIYRIHMIWSGILLTV